MKLGYGRSLKHPKWEANEQVIAEDIELFHQSNYQNITDLLATLASEDGAPSSTSDKVLGGLMVIADGTLNLVLSSGAALSYSGSYYTSGAWGFSAAVGDIFSVVVPKDTTVAIDSGDGSTRYDTIEIRPIRTEYNSEVRYFKNPTTEEVSSASTNTRIEYGFEVQVKKGTPGGGSAPAKTAGWIKVAEVEVAASASSLDQEDVKYYTDSDTWTTEADSTEYKKIQNYREINHTNKNDYYDSPTTVRASINGLADFLHSVKVSGLGADFTTSGTGTIEQRVLHYKNLTISHDTTLKARCVYVEGDLTIDSSKVLTIEPLNPRGQNAPINMGPMFEPGCEADYTVDGAGVGGFGGDDGDWQGSNYPGPGGGGYGKEGGDGDDYPAYSGGAAAGKVFGGRGADGGQSCGGGGGGFGGGGGTSSAYMGPASNGGYGGDLVFFIVGGDFINNGTINNNGGNGDDTYMHDGSGAAGGAGGAVVIVAFGDSPTIGIINCNGGDSGIDQLEPGPEYDGGVGGGGHIEIYAKTSSWGTLTADMGANGQTTNAEDGTIWTIDISTDKQSVLGGSDYDADQKAWAGHLFRYLEGIY